MPHIVVKMLAGRSEQLKAEVAEELTAALVRSLGCERDSVSVAIEDVAGSAWTEAVYKPEIVGKWDTVYKKPGYNPL